MSAVKRAKKTFYRVFCDKVQYARAVKYKRAGVKL